MTYSEIIDRIVENVFTNGADRINLIIINRPICQWVDCSNKCPYFKGKCLAIEGIDYLIELFDKHNGTPRDIYNLFVDLNRRIENRYWRFKKYKKIDL